ncbi:MAG: hypothetical protein KIS66_11250 [Fimbriimonadaceae bacterium]|nr:hypothetical protein [Fimbriimonadaceae bacterium]
MVVSGDVLAVIAAIFLISLSTWAAMVALAALFPRRVRQGQDALSAAPGRTLVVGLIETVTTVALALVLANATAPLAKVLGAVLLFGLFFVASFGLASVASLVGAHLQEVDTVNAYQAFSRGAAVLIVACWLPFLGWFLFTPILLSVAVGAGWKAVRGPRKVTVRVETA